jgi:hypothetical protein
LKPFAERVFADEYGMSTCFASSSSLSSSFQHAFKNRIAGHVVAMRALGCIDDTVLLRKVLLPEVVRCVPDMVSLARARQPTTIDCDRSRTRHATHSY